MADINFNAQDASDIPGKTLVEDPKNITLSDGTPTEVAQDNTIQNTPIIQRGVRFNFQSGNFGDFDNYASFIASKFVTVKQTILPLVEVALIELLGNDASVRYERFNFKPTFEDGFRLSISITASTKDWLGDDISLEATQTDARYVLDRLSVVPDVRWEHCIIDTKDGTLTVEFTI